MAALPSMPFLSPCRRAFLAGSLSACILPSLSPAQEEERQKPATNDCPRCGGLKRVPLKNAKPFVWLKDDPPLNVETAVGVQFCPQCQMGNDPAQLLAELQEQVDAAVAKNLEWEERTGFKLLLAVTHNVTLHTQLTAEQARAVGKAIETFALHLARVTDSLLLTPTRPSRFGLMVLWEKSSWTQFRKVMEGLYTREQLGESWTSAANYNSYDHFVTPHMYETPESVRTRPPTVGSTFIVARRQLSVATSWRAPFWLSEGFAAYADYIVHKTNRWFTVYDPSRVPTIGDWMQEARRQSSGGKSRPWNKLFDREVRDFAPADYSQAMAMVAFLLESKPPDFLNLARKLRARQPQQAALESAYEASLTELEQRCKRWLVARK